MINLDEHPQQAEATDMDDLSSATTKRLRDLRDATLDENTRINLTALRDPDACWIGNILDSLALLEILEHLGTLRSLIDIGTGGGFPLLPLATVLPDVQCTGLDSTKKKMDAVGRIAMSQGLRNIHLLAGRAEDIAHDPLHREHYDLVVARAVADLSTLLEYTSPFARIGGHIVLWKSLHIDDEVRLSSSAQRVLRCTMAMQHVYTLPGDFGTRQLLLYRKEGPTPRGYPRPTGVPGKQPIR